ncbi:hypothetical protein [Ornithinimicrobium flavum]|uniref:hypothetical protein n=1 Tax=Ornithinimicrobium flavum TaxID=1288636 RepID=UPI00106F460F|nr:hypothetical protein [Ornithinimicrobium flavum]
MQPLLPRLRALRRPGSYWHLHRYVLDLDADAAAGPPPGVTAGAGPALVPVNQADLDEMRATCPDLTDRKYDQLRERIGAADITAYLIRDADGSWAGYCHLAYRRFVDHYLSHVVRLRRHEVLFVDDQVFPSHRRRGLHVYSIRRRCELARERGMRTGVVVINDRNAASIASYRHVGIRPARRLVLVRPFRVMIQIPRRRR